MFTQLKTNEVGLLLHGLRSIYVRDEEKAQVELTRALEAELASRGFTLDAADDEVYTLPYTHSAPRRPKDTP
jgi:hypothetical protein